MARFYASIEGGRGEATRQGHSFIRGHIRGWRSGVKVTGDSLATDRDSNVFVIWASGGSNSAGLDHCIGSVRETPQGRVFKLDERLILDAQNEINLDELIGS